MKIVAISDTHSQLNKLIERDLLPHGDLLIHSGDATYKGTDVEIFQFNQQLGKLKKNYTHGIVFVPGNHDINFADFEDASRLQMTNATVLIGETVEVGGLKIHGDPHQPWFFDWAFNFPGPTSEGQKAAEETWAKIPNDVDILITHGPPHGILDWVPGGERVGCPYLRERIRQLHHLSLHVFGHIHCAHGVKLVENTLFVNAAICSEEYKPVQPPIVVHL